MCCRCIGLGTMSDAVATVILPFVAPGFSGSNVTVPETPLALPLMDSNGASSLNPALLMLFGILEVEHLRRGENRARQGDECQNGEFRFHGLVRFVDHFDFAGTKMETPARTPAPSKAAPRKSTPGTNLSCH